MWVFIIIRGSRVMGLCGYYLLRAVRNASDIVTSVGLDRVRIAGIAVTQLRAVYLQSEF